MTLSGCSISSADKGRHYYEYSDFKDSHILYPLLLKMEDFEYFTYIYSEYCLHCEKIKQQICEFALSTPTPFYFLHYSNDIPITDDISTTLNQNTLSSFSILGTPTLVFIREGTIKANVCGEDLIMSFLEEYKSS